MMAGEKKKKNHLTICNQLTETVWVEQRK